MVRRMLRRRCRGIFDYCPSELIQRRACASVEVKIAGLCKAVVREMTSELRYTCSSGQSEGARKSKLLVGSSRAGAHHRPEARRMDHCAARRTG